MGRSNSSSRFSLLSWRCWGGVQHYLLGPHLQLGLQLAVGIILTSLPVFIRALRFPHACFSSVLMVIGLVSMSPDGHIGTKLLAAYQLVGQAWLGAITAGAMVSIAKPLESVDRGAYIALLCVTTAMGLGLLTSARAGPNPITLWPNITLVCLNFAVVVLWSQSNPSLAHVWRDDVGGMCACGLSAAVAVGIVSTCVLPTVATEEVVRLTSAAVRGSGHSLSRYLSLLLDTSGQTAQHSAQGSQRQQPQQQQDSGGVKSAAGVAVADRAAAASDSAGVDSTASNLIDSSTAENLASSSSATVSAHALSVSSSIVIDARDLFSGSSAPNSPFRLNTVAATAQLPPSRSPPTPTAAAVEAVVAEAAAEAEVDTGVGAVTVPAATDTAEDSQLDRSCSVQFAPEHMPVQLLPLELMQQRQHRHCTKQQQQHHDLQHQQQQPSQHQQRSHHEHEHRKAHTHGHVYEHEGHQKQASDGLLNQHLQGDQQQQQQDGQRGLLQQQQQQQQQQHFGHRHHHHHVGQLHRGQHVLRTHERHHHPHASVLPTPYGPVAVLGPSVDELRRLLMAARTALGKGTYEPSWCGSCGGGGGVVLSPRVDVDTWRELLAAAEQLINVVSTLQDVLVYASPRLLHPSTAISSSLASFSATAQAVIGTTINSTAQLAEVLVMRGAPADLLEHRARLASASWSEARHELERSRASAVQHYWSSISSNSGKLVAASSEALAVMFVWVAVGGVMTAVERLDVAGSRLMRGTPTQQPGNSNSNTTPAAAAAVSGGGSGSDAAAAAAAAGGGGGGGGDLRRSSLLFSRTPSKLGLEASHIQQQHEQDDQQQQQQQQQAMIAVRSSGPQPLLPLHHVPAEQQPATAVASNATAVAAAAAAAGKHFVHSASPALSALLLLPVLKNIVGFWVGQLGKLRFCYHTDSGEHSAQRRSWIHRLQHNRAAAAALKLWLGMSGLVVLFILVAENPQGRIHPTVSYAVMTVPTHGVIALVLAWHERVESTFIRVFLRIAGTAAGATVGWAALHATRDPVLLVLIMAVVGVLIAPLASASFHFRLATALTVISMLVVVLCQFDPKSGESRATDTFYGTRVIEVTIACLWAACFNKLLLPWSSRDWSLEQISAALTAGSDVFSSTSKLQFQAATPAAATATAQVVQNVGAIDSNSMSGGVGELAASLLSQESALQKRVVEPMVAVQTALSLETHVWRQRSAPRTVPKALKTLAREMLLLADRITSVQVAVAALPHAGQGAGSSSNNSDGGRSGSKQHGQRLGGRQVAVDDADRSIQYVVSMLMQPLHDSHAKQLHLVAAIAVAVKVVLLEPSKDAQRRLLHLMDQLEWERSSSNNMVASLRKQLHHDVMHAHHQPGEPHPGKAHRDATGNSNDVDGVPSVDQQAQHLVRCLSVAMSSEGVLPVVGQGGVGIEGVEGGDAADVAIHISRWWWVHAGEHYCQLLAFQYAFDAAVVGVLAVATTSLTL